MAVEMMTIGGWEFPRHPPQNRAALSGSRKWTLVLESITFAKSQLTSADRVLWMDLCRLEARVRTLQRDAADAMKVEGPELSWSNEHGVP